MNQTGWKDGGSHWPRLYPCGPLSLCSKTMNPHFPHSPILPALPHDRRHLSCRQQCRCFIQDTTQLSGLCYCSPLSPFPRLLAVLRISPDADPYSVGIFILFILGTDKMNVMQLLVQSALTYYIFHQVSSGQFRKYHLKTLQMDLTFTVLPYI